MASMLGKEKERGGLSFSFLICVVCIRALFTYIVDIGMVSFFWKVWIRCPEI